MTSDAGLLLPRELDERLGLNALIERHLGDPRTGRNRQFPLPDLFRQSIYSRLAGYEDINLRVIAYNLGNLLRRLVLPLAIQSWSLTSLRQRGFKTGGRLIRQARYYILQLAESHLTRTHFGQILGRIARLAWHPT